MSAHHVTLETTDMPRTGYVLQVKMGEGKYVVGDGDIDGRFMLAFFPQEVPGVPGQPLEKLTANECPNLVLSFKDRDAVLGLINSLQNGSDAFFGLLPTTARLYYEAHITIDPVPEADRAALQALLTPHGFKLAKLLMQKGEPSNIDTFCTAHGTDLGDIKRRTLRAIEVLEENDHTPRRWKIEDTLFDSRHGDSTYLLEDIRHA